MFNSQHGYLPHALLLLDKLDGVAPLVTDAPRAPRATTRHKSALQRCWYFNKLDGVGPIDNRAFTD